MAATRGIFARADSDTPLSAATTTSASYSSNSSSSSFTYSTGYATMTHYDLPYNYVAACGCQGASTHYPTAALSQFAYGSAQAYGPGCGRCFNLTLLNTFLSDPPWYPDVTKSIVIKVTDLCPITSDWCTATEGHPNEAGNYLNFDLAWPSKAIPDDFYPTNQSYYGYADFGVWNVSYAEVTCTGNWAGANDKSAMSAVTTLGDSVCCPGDVTTNNTCPSYSEDNGVPADSTPSGDGRRTGQTRSLTWFLAWTGVVLVGYGLGAVP